MSNEGGAELKEARKTPTVDLGHDTAPDITKLQAELAQLQKQVDEHEVAARARHQRGRRWVVGILIALGITLLTGGNMTLWLRRTVLSTDGWVSAVGPLSRNETVAKAVSTYTVDGMFHLVQAEQLVREKLPVKYNFLGGAITRVLQNVTRDAAASLVQSDEFNTVWVGANRIGHQAVIGVLRGNQDLLYLQDGHLTVDVGSALSFVTNTLGMGSLERLQTIRTRFVLLESRQVAAAQQALGLIDAVGLWLPLLAVGVLGLAWRISLQRRRTVAWIGFGIMLMMVVSLGAFALMRPVVLASIADPFVRLLVGEIWNVVTGGLQTQTILVLIVGLFLLLGAALTGSSLQATAIRNQARNGWAALGKRLNQSRS